jgi:hypothetical protein
MKKLLVLLSLSSVVCAMSPARLAMSDEDAPSFISKNAHKFCCGVCCATVVAAPATLFSMVAAGTLQSNYEKCANTRGCDADKKYGTAQAVSPMALTSLLAVSVVTGYVFGSKMGEITYEIDQSLNAVLSKEKTE